MSECFVCFNCIEDCPEKALSFRIFPPKEHEVTSPDVTRRRLVIAGLAGLVFYPLARATGRSTRDFSSKAIRPPGAVEELEFLARCIKCDQCVRVCPTSVIQPAWFESGIEGLWTPVLNFRVGHCQLNCTACGYVCPTGALQHVTLDQKLGRGDFANAGPIRLGTAHVDPGRCLPFSKNVPCVVCEEVCPTSPKAIHGEREFRMVRNGRKRVASSTGSTLTLHESPTAGQGAGAPVALQPNQWRGDETARYHVELQHSSGVVERHRIATNDADSITIEGTFAEEPAPGDAAVVCVELQLPHVDTTLCIGCGICERECPVVGDRRAIYVTAEGETRSQLNQQRDRNRTVRLIRS
jgi:formate hydrogenlyase subunit 6/NADH:ubiquinone oxidoreductase subunit I